jgi:AhpC/TSA family
MVCDRMRYALLALAGSACVTGLHVTHEASVADGVQAPAFALPDQSNHTVALADQLARGPVVLVFYRGYW